MSEPIKWSGDGRATVDGIQVRCDRVRVVGMAPVWFVMNSSKHDECVTIEHMHDRDLAARAVVAAVKVLRGEGEADAAVAAERERCLRHAIAHGSTVDLINVLATGAPAPREG